MLGPDDPLSDDAITGSFRVWQRVRGHRYSLDDVLTAREAWRASEGRKIERACDLGCGLGSVLLMVTWAISDVPMVGIEAQDVSFELARRNVARNGLTDRVLLLQGDLRDPSVRERARDGARFDLVTGTPPYVPPGRSTPSPDPQKAHARVELRGGIEDYLEAASELVSEDGVVVVCGDARFPERAFDGAAKVGLHVRRQLDACPRAGRPPLFSVWTFTREAGPFEKAPDFIARDASGLRTEAYFTLRTDFGLPPTHTPTVENA
ncbi:MAG: methyltransferase domain-containing protein [Sandaracinus sp.]|nr:methyltransferase domain-containing protein [Sandaracinus sp.]